MADKRVGPHPGLIRVAKAYIFEHQMRHNQKTIGVSDAKEDSNRLLGVAWIDEVRKVLKLPIQTYNTAVVYYHKFRLVHSANEFDYRDAAAAALFAACKIEDTLKKSRDILCAAMNIHRPSNDPLSPDDPIFEAHSKTIVGLERLMLEASGFNFRNRHPQRLLCKLVKASNLDKDSIGLLGWNMTRDLYRTFAPLKQTTQTMALSCFELAIRLSQTDLSSVKSQTGFDYELWHTSREEVMETLLDLLDLYINHRASTIVGAPLSLDDFIAIRITLNQEASARGYSRYTNWRDLKSPGDVLDAPGSSAVPIKEAFPPHGPVADPSADLRILAQSTLSPGERGKEGTVRFIFDAAQARDEKKTVAEFFREDEYEYVY